VVVIWLAKVVVGKKKVSLDWQALVRGCGPTKFAKVLTGVTPIGPRVLAEAVGMVEIIYAVIMTLRLSF
jgi:hypothetical protein